jgi:hypothetical protein
MAAQLAIGTVVAMRTVTAPVLIAGLVASVGACSTDGRSPGATAGTVVGAASTVAESSTTTASSDPAEPSAPAASSIVVTAPPEPTGVPGLDDEDPFCVAWVHYLASVQAISVAAAFGDLTPDELVAIELAAAPSITAAGQAIVTLLPEPLAAERDDIADRAIGPFVRRAQAGVDALVAAGATDADLDQARRAWSDALASRVPEDPVIAVRPLGGTLADVIVVAGRAFATDVSAFTDDPSLIVGDVPTPLLDTYLAEQCPAVADSGGGDTL